tara:strand:- start:4027 stop:4323 length:297 start_codon:yes stop_codon:yes gene_type:complete
MTPFEVLEKFGLPIAMTIAFGWYIWKQTQFMQKFLMDDMVENMQRLEKIIITLISQQKELQMETKESLADMRSSYESLVEIVKSLTGNGLKKRSRRDE